MGCAEGLDGAEEGTEPRDTTPEALGDAELASGTELKTGLGAKSALGWRNQDAQG